MKKSLIALAVLSAVAGAAQAQSNVTVYGVLDMAINNESNGVGSGGATKTALDSGVQSGSRLGFKGSEDLGGGLKANFKLEMGVNADAGKSAQGGLAFGRAAWVGLSGDFGALQFGRQNKPVFNAVDSIDPFETGIIGGTAGDSTSATGLGNLFFASNPRSDNTANYTTNNLGGFTGTVAYTFGEQAGDTGKASQIGASATYAAGPLSAVIAYNTEKDKSTPALNLKHTFAGLTYNFNVVKLAAAYGLVKADAGYSPNGKVDNRLWMIGATVPVSAAGAVIGSYTQTNDKLVTDGKGNQVALGYTHSLSKRTNLYTSFSRIANGANANAGGLAYKAGVTERMFNVGIRHMF
ncbi:porin [Undibacterium piscinae]|uniref:Porin n=1 Tax=Undibacterium piscinae TaxID=2495591 RepID=A0A6M4A4I3_9BURK|nr:porin [Undibacterium piscinae]